MPTFGFLPAFWGFIIALVAGVLVSLTDTTRGR
jgi:hypothetical protein